MPCAGDGSSTCFPPFVVRLAFNLASAGTIRCGGSRLSLYMVPALARRGDGSTLRRGLERRTFPNPTSNVGPISTTPTATANPTPSATCYVDSCDKPSLPFLGSKKATQICRPFRAALQNVVPPASNLLGCQGAMNASAEMTSAAPPP
jgi:hypothetical protein